MTTKTIFLDRDGVINIDKKYLYSIDEFEFIEGIFDACKFFLSLNYSIVIITNQSGIGRGYYTKKDFETLNMWMINEFKKNEINILDVLYCPHLPNANCICRKPKPGMLFDAKNKHHIDFETSWLIGDSENDIIAANNAGIKNTIIVKTGNKVNEKNTTAKYILESIHDAIQVVSY
jgi:D-glycero-D-manno-heptose 1,7-bisphosphate phosphatase